ncbi:MAG: diaminopimelate decarboxylase [Acidobacteria bacterium]|nr:MAG: diaminopimelate decarboxylase [Acidobacteriota bacterium]REK01151.1 MAG: diaminopimelate decarboxylase [Acidobacteriota bacterium]REK14107.1 MAG: diaminopimelate decarboxylase [Acidobacteriota bacterium]REK44822.1 MAG: diaminopimelate decarboxylase [Acidobacteriota bacterium]
MRFDWEIDGFLTAKGDDLLIDGVRSSDLADEFGTPLFVFSERRISENIQNLISASDDGGPKIKVCYASKANSNLAVLRAVNEAGGDIEVNSGGELFKALHAGFEPSQIIFNGTSKDEREIREAIEAGIYSIQADSVSEIELIEQVASAVGKPANVSLRLVPEIRTDTLHGLQTALLTSKFGMMPDEAVAAFGRWKDPVGPIRLKGIHIHLGSQNPSPEPYARALEALYREARTIFEKTGTKLEHFNIGGGFPVNYLRDRSHSSMLNGAQAALFSANFDRSSALRDGWKRVLEKAESEGFDDLLSDVELVTEPGRSIIADAGICLTTIRHTKTRPAGPDTTPDRWLLTDAGFNILLSMETYKWYYHIVAAARASEAHDTPYRLAGPLCDGGDVYFDIEGGKRLPDHRLLPEGIGQSDLLALLNCGAYSIAQMFPYNGRPLPAVVMIGSDGNISLARKRDEYKDLLRNEV